MHNPYSGHQAPDSRFCFHVRAIAHRPLFLPIEMKTIPQIKRLLERESPLSVFNCHFISSARMAFNDLRKQFDFAYWALKEYHVRDIKDADNIVHLYLNDYQHYVIDIIQKRYHNCQLGRYIISKSFGKVGLSTCIQAYILWLQTYCSFKNSYTCSASDISIHPLKTNLCRYHHWDIVPSAKFIFIPKAGKKAFFNTYRSPDYILPR